MNVDLPTPVSPKSNTFISVKGGRSGVFCRIFSVTGDGRGSGRSFDGDEVDSCVCFDDDEEADVIFVSVVDVEDLSVGVGG